MDYASKSLEKHYEWKGKLETVPKMVIDSREALSLAYTPGVAQPCLEIHAHPDQVWSLTGRGNTVAVVSDGSAVLGLGNIGPEAALPVMEGKCALFKTFGGVDAVPICLDSQEVEDIVNAVRLLAPSFGGINLEDIAAPRCFEVERRLRQVCSIPIFHDDQHGTSIVVAAALTNALKVVGKKLSEIRLVISGAGAAGTATYHLLRAMGLRHAILCNSKGILYPGRPDLQSGSHLEELARLTAPAVTQGGLAAALRDADVFIGLSAPGLVTEEMVRSMAPGAVVFAMANPTPEIMPDLARKAGAAVVGTGRSDFPNQINNVHVFPGVFRGALDAGATAINTEMEQAAVSALASLVGEELRADYLLPAAFDPRVCPAVAAAVAQAARSSGVCRAS